MEKLLFFQPNSHFPGGLFSFSKISDNAVLFTLNFSTNVDEKINNLYSLAIANVESATGVQMFIPASTNKDVWFNSHRGGGGGRGVLPEKLGMGVRPAYQNPYPIYDQNLRFSLPYL